MLENCLSKNKRKILYRRIFLCGTYLTTIVKMLKNYQDCLITRKLNSKEHLPSKCVRTIFPLNDIPTCTARDSFASREIRLDNDETFVTQTVTRIR